MIDFNKVLLAIAPRGKAAIRAGCATALPAAIDHAELTTPLRLAHFLAQCAHESAGFTTTTEFASGADYEGRKDLGNVQKGDGKRFKGRGLLQITGRANYLRYGKAIGLDLIGNPDSAAAFPAAALTAAEYWRDRDLNRFADNDDVRSVTRGVNGGLNGLDSRKLYLARAKQALGDLKGALLAGAAAETAQKNAKHGAAGVAAPIGLISTTQMQASPWLALVLVSLLAGCVAALLIAANRHKKAATELTAAAQGV